MEVLIVTLAADYSIFLRMDLNQWHRFGVCFAGVRMCLSGDDESKDKKEEVKEALKGMSPEKIAVILSVIQK